MRIVEVERRPWTPEAPKTQAPPKDGLDDDLTLVDAETGRVVAVQFSLGDDALEQRRELGRWLRLRMPWPIEGEMRLSGIRYGSKTFGYTAPAPLRRRWAPSMAHLNRDYPEAAELLDGLTTVDWRTFVETAPDEAAGHDALVRDAVHADWLIDDQPWTSGIINNTAALPYHKDRGNIAGSWSAMLAIRRGVDGGCLDLPEYGLTFAIPDGSITLFDGQGTWHGVTPLEPARSDAYRFTMVWYAKAGFVGAGPAAEALEAGQRRASP